MKNLKIIKNNELKIGQKKFLRKIHLIWLMFQAKKKHIEEL